MAQSNQQSWNRTLGPSGPSNCQGFVLTLEPEDKSLCTSELAHPVLPKESEADLQL